jgi:hypothetical protein
MGELRRCSAPALAPGPANLRMTVIPCGARGRAWASVAGHSCSVDLRALEVTEKVAMFAIDTGDSVRRRSAAQHCRNPGGRLYLAYGGVVVAGLAEIAAGSIAMGLGGFLAAKSDAEHYEQELAREKEEVGTIPEAEAFEISDKCNRSSLTLLFTFLHCPGEVMPPSRSDD